jgi:salicylate hydroxylase
MAVEDGAILGILLSKLLTAEKLSSDATKRNEIFGDLFGLYEGLRKKRTATNVEGAVHTRHYYHLADGEEQKDRDRQLAGLPSTKWQGRCSFNWGDAQYQKSLLGFDVLVDAANRFDEWHKARSKSIDNHQSML